MNENEKKEFEKQLKAFLPYLLIQLLLSVTTTIVIFYGGYYYCPFIPVPSSDDFSDKLVYSLRCSFAPVVLLVVAIAMVGFGRVRNLSINPLAGYDRLVAVQKNYLTNTVEQIITFCLLTLVLITYLTGEEMRLVPLYATAFVVGRVIFRIGYGIHPNHRAWGVWINFLSNYLIVGLIAYFMYTRGVFFQLDTTMRSTSTVSTETGAKAEL